MVATFETVDFSRKVVGWIDDESPKHIGLVVAYIISMIK
jgi:hypothetical protein